MSAELRDFRMKITIETALVLEAEAQASERDRADVAREILHSFALRKIHEATILSQMLQSEGLAGAGEGRAGNPK